MHWLLKCNAKWFRPVFSDTIPFIMFLNDPQLPHGGLRGLLLVIRREGLEEDGDSGRMQKYCRGGIERDLCYIG